MNNQIKNTISYFKYIILDKLKDVNCWVAGGAIRDYFSIGGVKTDIDIFFTDENQYNSANNILSDNKVVKDNIDAKLIKYNNYFIHLIKKHFYPSPKDTIDSFDFTVCCSAVDKDNFYCHDSFFIDLSRRRLVINKLPYPISSLQRMQKYIKKGYWICNGGLLELSKAIQTVDLTNKDQNVFEFYPDGTPRFKRID